MTPPAPNRLQSLQALRFYAAAIVVIFHAEENAKWLARTHADIYLPVSLPGDFGVYIFFIISGFIMGHVTHERYGQPGEIRRFLVARLSRIVPIYWILTACMAVLTLVLHFKGAGKSLPDITLTSLIKSLLFIPYIGKEEDHWPILGQGWSLNHEMLFYFIIAAALSLRESVGKAMVVVTLVTLTVIGAFIPLPEFLALWARPVNLLFLLGLSLASMRPPPRLDSRLCQALLITILLAAGLLNKQGWFTPTLRVVIAFALVWLCIMARNNPTPNVLERVTEKLGDASYSMYLIHTFLIYSTSAIWAKKLGDTYLLGFVGVILLESILVSWFVNRTIEVPLNRHCRRGLDKLLSYWPSRLDTSTLRNASRQH